MFQVYFCQMSTWKELITANLENIEEDRVRIILEVEGVEIGVMYFERAKKGWNKKPLTQGWTCVDAKVEGLYVYGGDSVTPKELVAWGQQLINEFIPNP